MGSQLERIDDPIKIYRSALGQIARHLKAEAGAVILRRPVSGDLQTLGWGEGGSNWDAAIVSAFLDLKHPELPRSEILAPILIGGRAAGLMALRRRGGAFEPGEGRFLARLCRKVGHEAALREE